MALTSGTRLGLYEIESAASDLDDAHEHVHGPDCDHTHEPAQISHLAEPAKSAKRAAN